MMPFLEAISSKPSKPIIAGSRDRTLPGPIFAIDPRKRIAKIVRLSGMQWKRNGLRHSFGSYRMEQTKNEGLVALEMGQFAQGREGSLLRDCG